MINKKTLIFLATILIAGAYKAAQADQSQPLALGPLEVLPSGNGMLMIGVGGFDALWPRDSVGNGTSALLNVEYRFGKKLFYLGLVTGVLVNSDSGGFVYVGNYVDIRYKKFIATPLLSVGAYSQGAGPDLGGTLEFRSSITFAYELEDKSRIGVGIAHISNASIHDENPGENEILVSYSFHF
ncbi:MAG: acyloxyacyl hydrolase [Gammaproteobacteria bacterium]|nr:acyloxyacyl hydrolase [Gammaproteobacteria bacterium]MDH3411738.1 acyloxyacyl hydrolase [Gammaproteobacteria bacterium]